MNVVTAQKTEVKEPDLLDRRSGSTEPRVRTLANAGCSLAGMAALTWVAFHLQLNLASTGFLYLILIVLTAVYCGFLEATVTSIAAATCLNFFFDPPIFNFSVTDTANWVAFGAFEFTALVISRLTSREHMTAANALVRQSESEQLYETARRILLVDKTRDPGDFITSTICQVFRLKSVILFDAVSAETYVCGDSSHEVERRTRGVYYLDSDEMDPRNGASFLVLRLGMRPVGSLGLVDSQATPIVASALASLSAIVLERSRSFERECRAEAARQGESLRAGVLDALAHDIKTPLTIIRTASSGLLAAGGLDGEKTELLSLIDEQSSKLNDLASHLLRAARLDSSDFGPQLEPILLSSVLKAAIETFDPPLPRDRFCLVVPSDEIPTFGDRKLIQRALVQLLDNALKYSVPDSPIELEILETDTEIIVEIRNQGHTIAPADRERIFERFYRGPETRFGPSGTGLGLAIVKRIVDAHRGRVWVESGDCDGTVFSIALPREFSKTP
jgi:two-component system sensor histidine kinase KdpD